MEEGKSAQFGAVKPIYTQLALSLTIVVQLKVHLTVFVILKLGIQVIPLGCARKVNGGIRVIVVLTNYPYSLLH
jgi:hypothetical protein